MLNPLIFSNQNRFLQSQFDRKRTNLLGRAPVNTASLFYRPVSAIPKPRPLPPPVIITVFPVMSAI